MVIKHHGAISPAILGKGGIKQALLNLPNRVIPSLYVSEVHRFESRKEYTITFSDADTPGDQHLLTCNSNGCDTDGCQPYYSGIRKFLPRMWIDVSGNPRNIVTLSGNSMYVNNGATFTDL